MNACALIARGMETLYLRMTGPHRCRKKLAREVFDGRTYATPDAFYRACEPYFDRPADFYHLPPEAPTLELRPILARSSSAAYTRYVFDSPVATDWPTNDVVPFKWFRQPDTPARTIVLFTPGWGRANQSMEEGMSARLLAHGIDVGLMTVPFHQARAPAGSRSGEYFISANLLWTVANFRQLTIEIRALIRLMREHYAHIVLLGMSSGAFQAGLASDCEPVDALLSLIGGCDVAGVTWHGAATRWIRRDLEQRGLDQPQLGRAWSIADQAVLGRHCQARYRKQYIARYDGVVPTPYQVRLWETYGRPDRLDIPASHVSIYFALPRIVDDMAAFLRRCSL